MKVYCKDCKWYWDHNKTMIESCKLHPYYNRNKKYNCKDYKRIWWKFWIKDK